MWHYKSFVFLMWISSSLFAQEVLINRVLLKINDTAYTQREMETYLLVKSIRKSQKDLIPTKDNWSRVLKQYKEDLLVYEESIKLRLLTDVNIDWTSEVQKLMKEVENDPALKLMAKRLVLIDQDYKKSLKILNRVEKYRPTLKDSPTNIVTIPSDRRVPYLEKRNYFRYYDDAWTYRLIQPFLFKLNP